MTYSKQYYKVWFSNGTERTAQLIVDTDSYPRFTTTLAEFSRLFPVYEAPKMKYFYMGDARPTWQEAFDSHRVFTGVEEK